MKCLVTLILGPIIASVQNISRFYLHFTCIISISLKTTYITSPKLDTNSFNLLKITHVEENMNKNLNLADEVFNVLTCEPNCIYSDLIMA